MFTHISCNAPDTIHTSISHKNRSDLSRLIAGVISDHSDQLQHLSDKNYLIIRVYQTPRALYSDKFNVINNRYRLLQYYHRSMDLFAQIPDAVLHSVRDLKTYLILDCGSEGFSDQMPWCNLWEAIYSNCVQYQIDPAQVIMITSNLVAEQAVQDLAVVQGWSGGFRVFSFPYFQVCDWSLSSVQSLAICQELHIQHHTDKIFSSLSRRNKPNRTWAQFQLSVSDIGALGLISHDQMLVANPADWLTQQGYPCDQHTLSEFSAWCGQLPLVVDQSDFSVNWALTPGYEHIHHSTCFQIVNESLTSDYAGSSMFYSEKTFRPIRCFQPFVIFGQPGANHHLKNLGYRLYDAWFDLSWDFIQDPVDRHRGMLDSLRELVHWLASCTPAARHQWRFQHADILQHNADVMHKSENIKNKLSEFLTQLP